MADAHPDSEFTGKYESEGRIGGLLVNAFYSAVGSMLSPHLVSAANLLEVGCGAGYSTERIRAWLPQGCSFHACDVGESLLYAAQQRNRGVEFSQQSVYSLALADKAVDVVVMLEVLEHLEHPVRALAELRRVARKCVVISTPREPIWRLLNFMRGKYVREFGNTPGHIQHWSSKGLRRIVEPDFSLIEMRRPLPWTTLSLAPRP